MELDLKQVNYLRELVELRPEKETVLNTAPDAATRKRERTRSQKIRRAVRRHEERVSTAPGRSSSARRKPGGESSTRNKVANKQQSARKPRG